jgi:hypothetical protein
MQPDGDPALEADQHPPCGSDSGCSLTNPNSGMCGSESCDTSNQDIAVERDANVVNYANGIDVEPSSAMLESNNLDTKNAGNPTPNHLLETNIANPFSKRKRIKRKLGKLLRKYAVFILTKPDCSYCTKAKELLQQVGIPFRAIDMEMHSSTLFQFSIFNSIAILMFSFI